MLSASLCCVALLAGQLPDEAEVAKLPVGKVNHAPDGRTVWLKGEDGESVVLVLLGTRAPTLDPAFDSAVRRTAARRLRELTAAADVRYQIDPRFKAGIGVSYGYLFADGKLVNRTLVAEGLDAADPSRDCKYKREIVESERAARREKLGVWTDDRLAFIDRDRDAIEAEAESKKRVVKSYVFVADTCKPGDVVVMHQDSGGDIPIFPDFEDYEDCLKLKRAKDMQGLAIQKEKGLALYLPDGTRLRVLSRRSRYNPFAVEVRVVDGSYAGRSGWIESGFLYRVRERVIRKP